MVLNNQMGKFFGQERHINPPPHKKNMYASGFLNDTYRNM